jgi:endonuclease/exonuclease/phosphatase (EEP) superfamily protein YafD
MYFLSRGETSTLADMARPAKDQFASKERAPDSATADVASLAAKVSQLPSHLEPAGQFAARAYSNPDEHAPAGLFERLLYWLACLVTLSLVTIGLLRIFFHDGTHVLIWLNAFTRYVYLPAYACLAWAIWKRRWFVASANFAVVCLHVALLAPDFIRDTRVNSTANSPTTEAPAAPTTRIFFANVAALNTEHQALLEEIKAADPDVIVLVEFSWLWNLAYRRSPVFAAYPYGGGMRNERLGMVNVFSRVPLKSDKQHWFGGRGLQTIEIPVGSETLHIIGLHAPRPMHIRNDDYDGFWSRTGPMILSEKGPLVVVGDFNATQYSEVYEQLTSDRLRSAHQDRGRGYATSWPNGQLWLPPIRIDHALLSSEVECVAVKEGEGRGSDHKPLILDVRIRPSR